MKSFFALNLLIAFCFSTADAQDCGTVVPPGYMEKLSGTISSVANYKSSSLKQVPVKIHIFRTDSGTGGLTEAEMKDVIDSMNAYYANASVEFFSCGGINYIDDSQFFDFSQNDEYLLQAHDYPGLINIYFANTVASSSGGSLCGYAYYPGGYDRILMANFCALNYSTLPHEMGHFMGLIHTHGPSNSILTTEFVNGSNCSSDGDLICDTPADPMLSSSNVDFGCNYTGNSMDANNDFFAPDPANIMSYSRKNCRNFFSPQQYQVIEYTAHYDRNYFYCNTASVKKSGEFQVLSVFPVPALSQVTIRGISRPGELKIFSSDGRLVKVFSAQGNVVQIPVDELIPGIYFFRINEQAGRLVRQ